LRIAPELESLLIAARELATRRGDASTTEEHLLLAFAATTDGMARLSVSGIRCTAFVNALEARLEASQPVSGYRGAAPRADLEHMLYEANDARGFLSQLLEPLSVIQVVRHECNGRFDEVCRSALFDYADVTALYNRAVAEAGRRLHRRLVYEHMLFAEFGRPPVKETISAAGIDVATARDVFDRRLKSSGNELSLLADYKILVGVACAHANIHRLPLSVEPLIVAGLRDPFVARSLDAAGIDAFDVIDAFTHRRSPVDSPPASGIVQVVLLNDHYSTFEFVISVLMSVFELSKRDARALANEVHDRGKASFGAFSANEASQRLARVRNMCREAKMPLRLELVPVSR